MLITIFEEKDFLQWCTDDVTSKKKVLIDRAYNLLMTMTYKSRDLKKYTMYKELLDSILDSVSISSEFVRDSSQLFNTCLINQCLTILYQEDEASDICLQNNVSYTDFKLFLTKVSQFVTDSAIVEWKMSRNLKVNLIKVEFPRGQHKGFFPVSSSLTELINVVQKLMYREVIFTPEHRTSALVSKKNIECYFSHNRLESEYLISQQLLEVYLLSKGFDIEDKYWFTDLMNWSFDEDTLEKAISIILTNRLVNLLAWEIYPVYEDSNVYDLLNFRCSDVYMGATCKYLCEYCRQTKLCSNCLGLDDVYNNENKCPLYKENSIIHRIFSLDELSTADSFVTIIGELQKSLID